MKEKVVIIGASIAGVYTVTELVRNKFDGHITIIDQKDVFPYNTYPLSKDWMMDMEEMDPPLLKKEEYYRNNNIDLKLATRVDQVNWKEKVVKTDKDEIIPYDHLVIATGSKLRKIALPGDNAGGIFYLREFKDAKAIKNWAKNSEDIVIVGTGFIGLEFASTFSQLGKNVSVLVRSGKPLEKILGRDVSEYFTKMHESHGVNFLFDEETKEFIKDHKGNLTSLVTKSGKTIKADMALIAVGVVPNLSFEIDSLDLERDTIIINEYGETSLPNIYAGGDIASWPYRDRLIHIEHWEVAWGQGTSIAKNIIKEKSNKYRVHPYFWTDQYDETFEYLGNTRSWDRTVIRGSLDEKKFVLAYLDEKGHPLAMLFANEAAKRKDIEGLLNKEEPLDESKFGDLNIDLADI